MFSPGGNDASSNRDALDWHTLDATGCFARLEAGPDGLNRDEATRRLEEHGPNEIEAAKPVPAWRLLLNQFRSVLIFVLLIAIGLSLSLGHTLEAIVITVIVIFTVAFGFLQEYRATRALEALRDMAAPMATALRAGVPIELPARELVPGDVVLLETGDRVPADVRLLDAAALQVNEAALTGESLPVDKSTDALASDTPLPDRSNKAHAGTHVTHGRARGLVVATGMQTELGHIARLLQTVEDRKTPLQHNLDRVGRNLGRAAFALVAVVVALGLWRGQELVDTLIFGIALAVAVVPEALPAVVTISLAIGVQRMVRRNALVRRLPAVETLGCVSVICSDKTGTLTRGEMTVRQVFCGGQLLQVTGAGYEPRGEFRSQGQRIEPTDALLDFLRAAACASDARVTIDEETDHWHAQGDPTEAALVIAAVKAGLLRSELDEESPRIAEIPFTSETKRMVTLHAGRAGQVAYVKGAPEVVLEQCSSWLGDEGERPLTGSDRAAVEAAADAMANDALRVLAVARQRSATLESTERDLVLLGLAGMSDPPRPEAKAAVENCREAGIRPIMITGDHPATAEAVARELGILDDHGTVLTGRELETLADDALARQIGQVAVFARTSPAQKLRVVDSLQTAGAVVAMTGDGVNDAPALKQSDIGVAMGLTGTDVSKEAADMTLLDDNFASIVAAVEEGRGIYSNIRKYLMYLLSSNIGEMGLMLAASLAGLPLPLSAVQILYVNLATDGLPALALAVDPPDRDLMRRPPRDPETGIFSTPVVVLMLLGGIWSAAVNLGIFLWALNSGHGLGHAMTMTFLSLVLIQLLKAYNFRSEREPLRREPFANRWLNRAVLWELIALGGVLGIPGLRTAFGLELPTIQEWLVVVAAAGSVVPVLELGKMWIRHRWPEPGDAAS